ncbi:putative ribosomal large subunit pseudouridine synthase svr1, chloroplastic [Stylosanthes scabra]|uniref:Ribosomal large subunit pseudouridine synthase svr1, chloroplastic n=1 Tax=Stylosanthes scabra TaxID=79078 RepID=A0ABU6TTX2_9FABA|nr:putative ribosomal large subunit pseudouridine synthase svr1, chloroplastic [Stylosanthes scabra]
MAGSAASTVAAAATMAAFSLNRFAKLTSSFRTLPRLTCSLSSSSSPPSKFNITFAPPKPKTKPNPGRGPQPEDDDAGPDQFLVPWIVRGEDGNLKLQTQPPAELLNAIATAETGSKKKKTKKSEREVKAATTTTSPPQRSKAARRFYNENFRDSGTRLSKVLAASGVASRRSCEELIFEGKVTVNGSVCNTPQTRVDPAKDVIYVNGSRLPKRQPHKVYLALNKPKGYICSSGENESKSVVSLCDEFLKSWDKNHPGVPTPRLFTVGRLDVATTGLIIVTNDGDFAQKLSHPSNNLTKEYIATVEGSVHKKHLIAISEGTTIDGIHCVPDSVELLPRLPDAQRSRLRIVVHDGRKHEVRELVKYAGLEIYSLKRVRIGGFKLPSDLGIGKYVELNPENMKALGWKS